MSLGTLLRAFAFGIALWLPGSRASAQATPDSSSSSLESLLNTRISAASKSFETAARAPGSVTIITAEEIRERGYTSFHEIIESVRGMYLSYDHNYAYLGTRGFSRPTDYNNRILLLVDGHSLNERVFGSVPVGTDLPINLNAISQVEIVRGPGSAIYGTNAVFAVINIVTKTGTQIDGASVSVRAASASVREATINLGKPLGANGSFAISGVVRSAGGFDRYYPEYDSPLTRNGIARDADWEDGLSGIASLQFWNLSAQMGYQSRRKGIPTGAYGVTFGDTTAATVDEALWAEVKIDKQLAGSSRITSRLFGDRNRYAGVYPKDIDALNDGSKSSTVGGEAMLIWDASSRNRLTLGAEYLHGVRAEYYEAYGDLVFRDNAPSSVASLFVQDEVQVGSKLTVVAGVRLDKRVRVDAHFAPRIASVLTLDSLTTIKLLYGAAFRSPSASESDLSTLTYQKNPRLSAERVSALELELQRRIAEPLLFSASLYKYWMRDLIDPVDDGNDAFLFQNVARALGQGLELQIDALPDRPFSMRAWWTMQRARGASGIKLTNSPNRIANVSAVLKSPTGASGAFTVRNESPRLTISGASTRSFTRVDLNLGYTRVTRESPAWIDGLDVSFRITNLLDSRYSLPGGLEHIQVAIPQDGRALSLRIGKSF